MKKILAIILLTVLIFMGGMKWPDDVSALDITLTIQSENVERIQAGFLEVYPNIECKTLSEADENGLITCLEYYTIIEWFKEVQRRWLVRTVRRGERNAAKKNAIDALVNDLDSKVE